MIYNYLNVMVEDIKDYIKDRYEYLSEIDKDVLYDDLFCEDSVYYVSITNLTCSNATI